LKEEIALNIKKTEALQESEAQLRTLSDNLPGGIVYQVDFGEDGRQRRFRYISAGVEQLHGIKVVEALSDATTIYGQVVEEDRHLLAEREAFALANMTPFSSEVRIRSLSGEIRWVLLASSPRLLSDNHLVWDGIEIDITSRKLAEEDLKHALEELHKSLGGTIQAMAMMVETRDPYTAGHQKNVSNLARVIAQEMDLSKDMIDKIRMAGVIHDIGKLSIPDEILSKPTKLTDIEFSLIKVHPRSAYDILKDVDLPYPIAEIVYQHHERLDGSGYPQGLKDGQILIGSFILAVADVVEAMSSHRPYRPGKGIDAALEEIEKNKGIFYDAKVVDACVRLFREKGFTFETTAS
jgi:PAS domain S-box-containing protein